VLATHPQSSGKNVSALKQLRLTAMSNPACGNRYTQMIPISDIVIAGNDTQNALETRMSKIKTAYETILLEVGEDLQRDGLQKTPERAAKAMEFLTQGYNQTIEEVLNNAVFESDSEEMVIVRNIEMYSLCEHHMLPFIGKCHVAYLPSGKVIGLSKIARIVDMYARRLQIQENMTKQIADAVNGVTGGLGVGVIVEAQHMCMMMRGVGKQNSSMTTSSMLGRFRSDINTRNEFLNLIKD